MDAEQRAKIAEMHRRTWALSDEGRRQRARGYARRRRAARAWQSLGWVLLLLVLLLLAGIALGYIRPGG